jgi:hypothetical protein
MARKRGKKVLLILAVLVVVLTVGIRHLAGAHITECGISKEGNAYAKVRVFKPFAGMGFTDKDHEIVEFRYPGRLPATKPGGWRPRKRGFGDTVIHLLWVSGIEHVTVVPRPGGDMGRISDPSKLTCVMKPWIT